MLLGIALHAALAFYPTIWPVTDVTADGDGYFDEFVLAVHGFRMPLFFLLSGFFTALLWRRRGLSDLLRHRSRRVLFPFFVAILLIAPSVTWVADRAVDEAVVESGDINGAVYLGSEAAVSALLDAGVDVDAPGSDGNTPLFAAAVTGEVGMIELLLTAGADPAVATPDGRPIDVAAYFGHREAAEALLAGGSPDPRPAGADWEALPYWAAADVTELGLSDPSAPTLPSMHHLWFLWFLILFLLVFAPFAWLTERLESRRAPGSPSSRWPRLAMWALMPVVVLPQLAMEGGGAIPAFGPDTSIGWIPNPVVFGYYLLFFGFGALLYGRQGRSGAPIVDTVGRRWWLVLPLAAAIFVVALWATRQLEPDGGLPLELASSALQVAYAWLMIFGLMGLFRAALSRERYWVRYLSDSAYWMYLTHLTVIIGLQGLMRTWDAPALLQFSLMILLTFVILLLSYQLFVRYTIIGTVLNGKRTRPRHVESRGVEGRIAAEPD
jgi:peptidoglycan/LPS O-acetylase OafA/YrhL